MSRFVIVYKKEFGSFSKMMKLLNRTIMLDQPFNISESHHQNCYYVSFELEINNFNDKNFRQHFILMLQKLNEHQLLLPIPHDKNLSTDFGFDKKAKPTQFFVEAEAYPIIFDDTKLYLSDVTPNVIKNLNIKKCEIDPALVDESTDILEITSASINASLPEFIETSVAKNRSCNFFPTHIEPMDLFRRFLGIASVGLTLGFVVPITGMVCDWKPKDIFDGYINGFRF